MSQLNRIEEERNKAKCGESATPYRGVPKTGTFQRNIKEISSAQRRRRRHFRPMSLNIQAYALRRAI